MASYKESDPTLRYLTKKETEVKLPQHTKVENKTPAPIQITAEHILREAHGRQDSEICPPKQKITDSMELADYRLQKRKEYEDKISRTRSNVSLWVKYAQWEESQKDFKRARSVWERALEVDYKNHTLWLKYAHMEMKNRFINHARNVWDRAISLLPRVDILWCRYIQMEEILGNLADARQIYERWMQWHPDDKQYGDKEGIDDAIVGNRRFQYEESVDVDDVIVGKRRSQYEDEVRNNSLNYDTWFEYILLEESFGVQNKVREVYEKAIANVPPAEEKRYWQRYIYLW